MATFTIDSENNIAAHAAVPANLDNMQAFATEKELSKLSAEWPGSRLVDVWNSFAAVAPFTELKPVRKFTNRKAAVSRIWTAVQRLSPDGADPVPDVALTKGKAKKSAAKAPRRVPARKGAKDERSNKKAEVLAMMKRAKGATLAEIMEATGWQAHTVRGFVSILGSKGGEKVESTKNAAGERSYHIAK
jgi:hypothetical protein